MKKTVFWDVVHLRPIALKMDAIYTAETSVSFFKTTRSNIPEDSNLPK
jgi:hypothetical protein